MRLILLDVATEKRRNFQPLVYARPIWELRLGMTTLGEKLIARLKPASVACFVPPYLAEVYRGQTAWPVNDVRLLQGEDLLLLDARVKADVVGALVGGPARVGLDAEGTVLYAWLPAHQRNGLPRDSLDSLLTAAKSHFTAPHTVPTWNYTWDLVLANAEQIAADFSQSGRHGIEGTVEEPSAIRGSRSDVYVAPSAVVHPMVVLDAEQGPIVIEEGAIVHPFSRIEGPCYIGRGSVVLGAKCRGGNSIGPMSRVGGEIEATILQGYSNKYHDGYLGHAYLGEWVNLGAMTTNSDLKNDYSSVAVTLDGRKRIDTGSTKVGALIGDHTKTSIGTLLNTGAYVGAMTLLVGDGRLCPKFIPSFAWYLDGRVSEGMGKARLYAAAKQAMSRRGCSWTYALETLWEDVFHQTAADRDAAVARQR